MKQQQSLSPGILHLSETIHGEAGAHSSQHWVRGRSPENVKSKSYINHRDKQPFTLMFTPLGNLELPADLIYMTLDCGRKL